MVNRAVDFGTEVVVVLEKFELTRCVGAEGTGGWVWGGLERLDVLMRVPVVTRPVFSFSFLDYWQVTLTWSPYGDDSLRRSLLIGDTSTTYYTDVAIRVTMTRY